MVTKQKISNKKAVEKVATKTATKTAAKTATKTATKVANKIVKNAAKKTFGGNNKTQITKVSKKVENQISSNKKASSKALTHNKQQDIEIAKLKEDILKLQSKDKAKKNTKRVSEYNLFIRKQILSGLTFERAVKEWNKFKALEAKNTRRPSAYNQFIGSQMRIGKTFTEAVALWKLAKAGTLGKKGITKTITKVKYKTRNVMSKPQIVEKIKYRTRTIHDKPQVVVKKVAKKPKILTKIVYRTKTIPAQPTTVVEKVDYNKLIGLFSDSLSTSMSKIETVSKSDISSALNVDDEEIAFKIVQTYFKEIARFGFKKQLTLDEIVDAYLYALARVKRNESQNLEVAKRVQDAGMRK
jgi:hypothetical protein